MTTPEQLPIRVLVKGASTVGWSSPMSDARDNLFFPRVIEQELYRSGRPAHVRAISVPSELVRSSLANWEHEMIGYSPDVVVLVYGHYESVHLFLPRWLERHANSLKQRSGLVGRLYRKHVLRPAWMALAKLQSRLDATIDPTIRRRHLKRVADDLELLVGHVQTLHSPLVYLFELIPPATRFHSWFPGMAARIEFMNDAIENVVKRIDKPNVRYFRIAELVDEVAGGDLDVATPDGFHYAPAMHRRIGELLARDIASWSDEQPHLKRPRVPRKAAAKTVAKKAVAKKTAAKKIP